MGKNNKFRLIIYLLIAFICSIAAYVMMPGDESSFPLEEGGYGPIIAPNNEEGAKEDILADDMEVHFIDVGHGDVTLIKCGASAMLIDTGDASRGEAVGNYLEEENIRQLDYLILTHPDKDHIGGASVIITKFNIGQVLVSNYEKDTRDYRRLMQSLDDKQLQAVTPQTGDVYQLGSAKFTIAGPNREYEKSNNASIAVVLSHGQLKFLFTGDAEEEAEEDILKSGIDISADVYHAGHHGGKGSSGKELLDAVKPQYAVISCEEGGKKGNPAQKVLKRFKKRGIKVFRTDEQGAIVVSSDGERLTWSSTPCETWEAE